MIEQYVNDASSTLSASMTSGATTLTVVSATPFPTIGNFRIRIDNELLLVTGVSGTTFTVTRGIEGTTAASHASGLVVTHVVTAQSLAQAVLNPAGDLGSRGMGIFVASHFEQNSQKAYIYGSIDGIVWSLIRPTPVYDPALDVRDPSIMFDGKCWWMAYTRVGPANSNPKWGLGKSYDLMNWTHVLDVDNTGIASTANSWAPEWFIDPDDGSIHVIVALSPDLINFKLYEQHPTSTDMTTWSAAVVLTGTSLPTSMIDAFMMKVSGTYYVWYKDGNTKYIGILTSTSLTSGYTVSVSGHWMTNWPAVSGQGWEGPCLLQIDSNTWYLLVDSADSSDNGLGYYYSIYTGTAGAGWLTGANWSSLALSTAPHLRRHGTAIRLQDINSFRHIVGGLINGVQHPGAYVSGSTSVPNSTTTVLTFGTTLDDDYGMFSSNKFTVPTTGFYHISGYVHWVSNSTGLRIIELRKNGSVYINGQSDIASSTLADVRQNSQALLYLNAGDYVELTAFQSSGSSLTPILQTFSIIKI